MRKALSIVFFIVPLAFSQVPQHVEGFGRVTFTPYLDRPQRPLDFRGPAAGYVTAGWWAKGQQAKSYLAWETAPCPSKTRTTFAFIGASSVTPPEFARGPQAVLSVNGNPAITFDLGLPTDRTWHQGDYELEYRAQRVEWPYTVSQRQFQLNGQSGTYLLTVPESQITAGKPVGLQVQILPFPRWQNAWFMVKDRKDAWADNELVLSQQVRQLQRDVANLGEMVDVLASNQYSHLLDTRDYENFVIYTDGYHHLHPADLIPLKNGDILITAREATEHIANDGDVIMLRSKDGGRTWGDKQVVAGIKDLDEREGCGVQLKDGTIVMGVYYNNLYRPDGSYEWDAAGAHSSTSHKSLGTYIITSADNGHTWSKPNFIDTKDMPFVQLEGPADAPVELPDGGILLPLVAYNVRGDTKDAASVLLRSDDKGKTWRYYSTMADDPGGKLGGFMEPGLLRTKSGRLVVAMRNHAPENAIWTSYSDDDGKTWKPARKSPMIGHPADLTQLADGRILCTYGMRPQHAQPGGIRATFSDDNGETWRIDQEVQIRKDFLNFDIGYPESLQMPDGRILTVYYFNLFSRYFLGGTFWKP